MSKLMSFFHFCAGVNKSILKRAPTDKNIHAGIGATVLFTGLFAAIAGSYALYTVFDSYVIAIIFGLFWGALIFNLDRYLVMSIKKKDKPFREFLSATPRLVLAILIAFVIAKPLELKLFESEIESELILMEQEKISQQEQTLRDRFSPELVRLKQELLEHDNAIEIKRNKRDELNTIAIQEADGTGGSGKKNLGPIYRAKKTDADLAQAELDNTIALLTPVIKEKRNRINELENQQSTSLANMKQTTLDGLAARLDALGRLAGKSVTIFWASIFITLLFIAIETAPPFLSN